MQYEAAHDRSTLLSRFFGVSRSNGGKFGKWASKYVAKGQVHNLGQYKTEELAAKAYDKVRIYQARHNPIQCGVVASFGSKEL